jgi:hypothetical protein
MMYRSLKYSKVTQKTRQLNEEPDKVMLAKLRILEKKMGLVLTLVRSILPSGAVSLSSRVMYSSKPPFGE